MAIEPFTALLKFLDRLEQMNLDYSLRRSRDAALEVCVHLAPCEYWEVEFFQDGHIEFQATTGIGDILYDQEALAAIASGLKRLEE